MIVALCRSTLALDEVFLRRKVPSIRRKPNDQPLGGLSTALSHLYLSTL